MGKNFVRKVIGPLWDKIPSSPSSVVGAGAASPSLSPGFSPLSVSQNTSLDEQYVDSRPHFVLLFLAISIYLIVKVSLHMLDVRVLFVVCSLIILYLSRQLPLALFSWLNRHLILPLGHNIRYFFAFMITPLHETANYLPLSSLRAFFFGSTRPLKRTSATRKTLRRRSGDTEWPRCMDVLAATLLLVAFLLLSTVFISLLIYNIQSEVQDLYGSSREFVDNTIIPAVGIDINDDLRMAYLQVQEWGANKIAEMYPQFNLSELHDLGVQTLARIYGKSNETPATPIEFYLPQTGKLFNLTSDGTLYTVPSSPF